uniref:Replication factor C C-terminal domain-containing protein n=2 Tax=Populus trichocarpa TaxID=3694 RepID=A0A2K1ZN42_POPTR
MHEDGEIVSSNRRKNQRMPTREERSTQLQFDEDSRLSERQNASRRMAAAPKQRVWDKEQVSSHDHKEQKGGRSPSPSSRSMSRRQREREVSHAKAASVGELNEIVANIKLSKDSMLDVPNFESTESISPGDIFFSVDQTALGMQKNGILKDNNVTNLYLKPASFPHMDSVLLQRNKVNGNIDHNSQRTSTTSSGSRMTMTSASAASRQSSSKLSSDSSKISDASGRTSGSLKKFTENRKKKQTEAWFSCLKKGPCKTSKSPGKKRCDETSFIEKAFVVESLRQFWADKHQPGSLNGFTCHKHEAQILGQLVSHDSIPHILLKGPSGSGKKALAMALIGDIFGDACWHKTHDLRYFQEQRGAAQVVVPITSSAHHAEINVNLEPNAKTALMGLVKEIRNTYAITPDFSNVNFKPDYKVLVLYEVDKAPENIQPLMKWIMDCYTDACKLILCCEDDSDILETVKNRCKVLKVDAPVTHEIMEVLIQIARKEEFDLPMNFAAKIAAKSKQNLRKAIMALEACKAHNYPFSDDQPIPFGWEEVLVELATEILIDPSPNKLFSARGKLKRLLVDFVNPKLILLKLVEQFLKGVEANSRRELYYWHAYYDKRLPTGTTALLKLEEFVAKFMSMYRKSSGTRQYV